MRRLFQTIHHAWWWPVTARTVIVATIVCVADASIGQQAQAEILERPPRSISDGPGLPTDQDLEFVRVDPSLADLVAKLDDPVFAIREAAMQRLLGGIVNRRQVCKVLARKDLSPEQRHRLLVCLRDDLLNAPRGAIGISVDPRRRSDEIVIQQLVEGLPAIEVLEPGDQIIRLDGQPAGTWESFVRSIQARRPGDKVLLTVERLVEPEDTDGRDPAVQRLDFEIVLGSTELLRDPATGQVLRIPRMELARADDAAEAANRFGPRPRLIEFRDRSTPEVESQTPQGG